MLEIFFSAVIRIGNVADVRKFSGAKIRETANFREIRSRGSAVENVAKIFVIHRENEIEIGVIGGAQLARAMRKTVASTRSRCPHSRIGKLPDVPIARAAGIARERSRERVFSIMAANTPFAAGERQMFPRHTNKIFMRTD